MSFRIKALIAIFNILVTLKTYQIETDDPNRIEAHSYEYYQLKQDPSILENCELDEMMAYGLSGDAVSLNERNEICPNLSQNCCGKKDQARIWEYWYRDRKRQEYYHRSVLKMVKYFLGYGGEWYRIASAIIDDYKDKKYNMNNLGQKSTNNTDKNDRYEDYNYLTKGLIVNANKYCKKAAKYIVTLNFNELPQVHTYYRMISEKTEFLENARRSFYCLLCSVEGQTAIGTWTFRPFNNIRYDQKFCRSIVQHTFRINYELYNTYNDYISNLLKMLKCVTIPDTTNPQADRTVSRNTSDVNFRSTSPPRKLTREENKMIESPLKNDQWFRFEVCNKFDATGEGLSCRFYCSQFNMAKPTASVDFDMYALERVYRTVSPYEKVFRSSRINFFLDDMPKLKQDIIDNFVRSDRSKLFYKTIVQHIDFSKYDSNFWIGSGALDPMELARGTPLPMNYASARIFMTMIVTIVMGIYYLN